MILLPKIVSREEWQRARGQLLIKEKAEMKAHEALSAEQSSPEIDRPTKFFWEG